MERKLHVTFFLLARPALPIKRYALRAAISASACRVVSTGPEMAGYNAFTDLKVILN
jgi:hypothetical protein